MHTINAMCITNAMRTINTMRITNIIYEYYRYYLFFE